MPWTRQQQNSIAGSTVSVLSQTFANPVGSGDLLILCGGTSVSLGVTSVGDQAGNSYVLADLSCTGGSATPMERIYYVASAASWGSSMAATLKMGGVANVMNLHITEYSGQQASPLDTTATGVGSSNSIDTNNFTTTGASDLLVAFAQAAVSSNFTPGTNWSTVSQNNNSYMQERLSVVAATYDAPVTPGKSCNWTIGAVAFIGAVVSGGMGPELRTLMGMGV